MPRSLIGTLTTVLELMSAYTWIPEMLIKTWPDAFSGTVTLITSTSPTNMSVTFTVITDDFLNTVKSPVVSLDL